MLLVGTIGSSLLAGGLGGPIVAVAGVSRRIAQRRCRAPLRIGAKVGASLRIASTRPIAVRHPIALWVALAVLRIAR